MSGSTATRTVDGLTWLRDRRDGEAEVWVLQVPDGFGLYRWVKNYGPKRERDGRPEPFSGWRYGSGGPFTRVGWWDTLDEALIAGTAQARREIAEHAAAKRAQADRIDAWAATL